MSKLCFLFGAGAEVPLGMSTGKDFACKVLGIDCKELNGAVTEYFKQQCKVAGKDWYPGHTSDSWEKDQLLESALRKKYLDDFVYGSKKDYEAAVKKELEELQQEKNEVKISDTINQYTSYMGLIDGSFHTLINPRVLGSKKFWRVLSCYTRAYGYLMGKMCYPNAENISETDYLEIFNNPSDSIEKMKKFSSELSSKKSYYLKIKDARSKNDSSIAGIVTTNYTTLCEEISGIDDARMAYIHGKFGWFESAQNLQIFDVEKEKLPIDDILFPYVFIQSGIKPIVDIMQLREYSKFLNFLDESQYLLVVGYRINADDNHLNSILRSFVLRGNHLIYFDYDKPFEKDKILKRLRLDSGENIEYIANIGIDFVDRFAEKINELL